jgi:hypothetical protein
MPAYDAAREALVAGLLGDVAAYEAGRYSDIGRRMLEVRAAVARQDSASTPRLQLALRFWGGWSEACADGPAPQSPPGADWPRLARALATDLALDRDSPVPSSSPAPTAPHQALVVRERPVVGTRLSDAFVQSE